MVGASSSQKKMGLSRRSIATTTTAGAEWPERNHNPTTSPTRKGTAKAVIRRAGRIPRPLRTPPRAWATDRQLEKTALPSAVQPAVQILSQIIMKMAKPVSFDVVATRMRDSKLTPRPGRK